MDGEIFVTRRMVAPSSSVQHLGMLLIRLETQLKIISQTQQLYLELEGTKGQQPNALHVSVSMAVWRDRRGDEGSGRR